eukprot:GCRY01004330.1.p1 GENE.GCRY01004330.1~~GCRY01004330.1.p1  ORF type:complete len:557 (+),score=81.11 GCRY01004330.1:222-1892(+)
MSNLECEEEVQARTRATRDFEEFQNGSAPGESNESSTPLGPSKKGTSYNRSRSNTLKNEETFDNTETLELHPNDENDKVEDVEKAVREININSNKEEMLDAYSEDDNDDSASQDLSTQHSVLRDDDSDVDLCSDDEVFIARKNKYEDEDLDNPRWVKHEKHIFILSRAGKPIYSRYGDEQKLASFMAVISAVFLFLDDEGDRIDAIKAGEHQFVFLQRESLFLVCVTRTGEPKELLLEQLDYLYSQIVALLTNAIEKIFSRKATYDLRNLLGGAEKFLDRLLPAMSHDPCFTLGAVQCVRMNEHVRTSLGDALKRAKHPSLVFSVIMTDYKLIQMVRHKKYLLSPSDLHLIFNFIHANQTNFGLHETWTPLCLPEFNSNAYLHAYIFFITKGATLLLLSTDPEAFHACSKLKTQIIEDITASNSLTHLNPSSLNTVFSVGSSGVRHIRHFLYKAKSIGQFVSPSFSAPYTSRSEQKRLFRLYQHLEARVNGGVSRKIFYWVGEKESALCWSSPAFELYAVFGPLMQKTNAINACNLLLSWIKQNERSLFLLNSLTW